MRRKYELRQNLTKALRHIRVIEQENYDLHVSLRDAEDKTEFYSHLANTGPDSTLMGG